MANGIFAGLKLSTALIVTLAMTAPGFAQSTKPAFKPMDVFDLQWAADPQVSPDGRTMRSGAVSSAVDR